MKTDNKREIGYKSLWKETSTSEYDENQGCFVKLGRSRGLWLNRKVQDGCMRVQRWGINMLAMLKWGIIQLSINNDDDKDL